MPILRSENNLLLNLRLIVPESKTCITHHPHKSIALSHSPQMRGNRPVPRELSLVTNK